MTRSKHRITARIEHDSMGELAVPGDALWGAQTQRAVQNFQISGLRLPAVFIQSLALIKWAGAQANVELGGLDKDIAEAIQRTALAIADGGHADQFPLDVFQTGSGTSTNMNVNEVIAHLASAHLASEHAGKTVHANDHVNRSQSSNDVIPSAIHLSAVLQLTSKLLPALQDLSQAMDEKRLQVGAQVKTGRTHLMDAMPVTLGQELSGWRSQIDQAGERLQDCLLRLQKLAIGGTAVGTGINAHPQFGARVCELLSQRTGLKFSVHPNLFAALSSQDTVVELSGQLRTLAVSLMKIANDLRWMNSGPQAGLSEIALPALQPGSSIMPGKVNPVIPEAVAMVAAQVMGNDATIAIAGQSGNFQLNVMLPVLAFNLLQSIQLLSNASRALADQAIKGFVVNTERMTTTLARNPILITALNELIGYEQAAAIAKQAYAEQRPIIDVALQRTQFTRQELERLLDPQRLTEGGRASES
jgi:fumarate hydratase, class II